ncbi:sigma-70 family RNA polymerase sigma factor [Echinicola shivajiensis]|uniref:sigma-70 family RNA polymerase sigma factor n=1 Tax=Echinicola shivajiensis TaxID=1035916 RepID=UPI001BFC576A|nr:sigma-70 family RNA polymerase sigma factor [Echinicola shivajiensis]
MRSKLELIFKVHYQELCLLAKAYVNDMSEAEDIVQDVFVKLLLKNNLADVDFLEFYVKRSIKNECLKRLRDRKTLISIEGELIAEENFLVRKDAELTVEKKNSKLLAEVNKLPVQCRKVFLMCIVEELTYQNVADKLEISVNTVKSQVKKAYKVLREALGETILKGLIVAYLYIF